MLELDGSDRGEFDPSHELARQCVGVRGRTPVTLRESKRSGASTRVQTELKAKGLYRPGLPPGDAAAEGKMPKPLQVEIETRFVFNERLVAVNTVARPGLASIDQVNAGRGSTHER